MRWTEPFRDGAGPGINGDGATPGSVATATAGLTIAQLLGVPAGSLLAVRSTSDPFVVVVGTGATLVTAALWRWFPAVPPSSPGGARPGLGSQYADLARTPRAAGRFGAYFVF